MSPVLEPHISDRALLQEHVSQADGRLRVQHDENRDKSFPEHGSSAGFFLALDSVSSSLKLKRLDDVANYFSLSLSLSFLRLASSTVHSDLFLTTSSDVIDL